MGEELTQIEALLACRDKAGSDSQLSRDLGVTQPRVWRWIHQAKQMPAEYVLLASRKYGVSRHSLRPDIYPKNIDLTLSCSSDFEPDLDRCSTLTSHPPAGYGKSIADLPSVGGP